MERAFSQYLQGWKNRKNRKPLIVRGARQVGKTYILEEFGKKHFDTFIKINFEEVPEYKDLFTSNDTRDIIHQLEVIFTTKINPGSTLIFLDEIQMSPQAIQSLRYFYENHPELHIVAAGSLLDHVLSSLGTSMPVGRVEFAYLQPMNFHEFLIALGKSNLVDFLTEVEIDTPISKVLHNELLKYLRHYYYVGGMPEAVKVYAEDQNLTEVERVHESILKSLEYDFSKYNSKIDHNILVKILRFIPKGLGKKLKYAHIDRNIRSYIIKEGLNLLELSRIIHLVKSSNAKNVPLEYGTNEKIFKALFLDIGLVNHLLKIRLIDIDELITAHEGALAEQFIGQQLITFPPYYKEQSLYYWQREKTGAESELDYLWEYEHSIIPIEVKAGKTGKLKSLHVYTTENNFNFGIRFNTSLPSQTNIDTNINLRGKNKKVKYQLVNLPLYLSLSPRLFKNIIPK